MTKAFILFAFVLLAFAEPLRSQTPSLDPSSASIVMVGFGPHSTLIPYVSGMKLMEAIGAAGDAPAFPDHPFLYLVHCGTKERILAKRMRSNPAQNPVLQPWDIVCLPDANF